MPNLNLQCRLVVYGCKSCNMLPQGLVPQFLQFTALCASINLLLSDFHCLLLSYYNPESVFSYFPIIYSGGVRASTSQISIVCINATTTQSSYFHIFHDIQSSGSIKLPSFRFLLSDSVLLQPRISIFIFSIIYSQVAV